MRFVLLSIALVIITGCVPTAQALSPVLVAAPTPTVEPPNFLEEGNSVQCHLNNGLVYQFTIKRIEGDWVFATKARSGDIVTERPMWFRIDAFSACWFN